MTILCKDITELNRFFFCGAAKLSSKTPLIHSSFYFTVMYKIEFTYKPQHILQQNILTTFIGFALKKLRKTLPPYVVSNIYRKKCFFYLNCTVAPSV